MRIIEIGASELMSGVQFDDNVEGAGLSPLIGYRGHNLIKGKGAVIYPQPSPIDTTVSGGTLKEIVASIVDPSYLGNDALIVDADGQFWTYDNDVLTYRQIDDTSGHAYSFGTTDIKVFNGDIFATCDEDIVKLPIGMGSIDKSWFKTTMGQSAGLTQTYRHPMEVVEDSLYIADQNKIHMVEIGYSVQNSWMTLPNNINITAMIKHPNGIYLMVFACEVVNYSHTQKAKAKIFVVDTVSGEFLQEIDIADQTEGAVNLDGTIFTFYGDNFGYFNGAGMKLIRKYGYYLRPNYSHRVTTLGNVLFFTDFENGHQSILAYGDVNGKGNIFHYPFYRLGDTNRTIYNILAIGQSSILINYYLSGYKLVRLDFSASTNGAKKLLSHKRTMDANSWIRRVDLYTEALVSDSGMTVSFLDNSESAVQAGTITYASEGAVKYKRIDCNIKTNDLQMILEWTGANAVGFKKALIYVESE